MTKNPTAPRTATKASQNSQDPLPPYSRMDASSPTLDEKSSRSLISLPECDINSMHRHHDHGCSHHGTESQTPHLDALLQQPNTRAALLALSSAFAAAAEDDRCLKCVIDSVVPDVAQCMQDFKKQKKAGEFSKEDKKAMKKEMKALFKGVKGAAKKTWKDGR